MGEPSGVSQRMPPSLGASAIAGPASLGPRSGGSTAATTGGRAGASMQALATQMREPLQSVSLPQPAGSVAAGGQAAAPKTKSARTKRCFTRERLSRGEAGEGAVAERSQAAVGGAFLYCVIVGVKQDLARRVGVGSAPGRVQLL